MKKILCVILGLSMMGCATVSDYQKYADAQIAMQTARSNADAERYKAMANIASTGDTATRVAAMMAMIGYSNGYNNQPQQINAPKDGWDTAKEWLGVLVPAAVSAYSIHANMLTSIASSNNSARTSMNASDNTRLTSVSSNASYASIAQSNATANTSIANTASDNSRISSTNFGTSFVDVAGKIQSPAANVTTTTTTTTSDNHSNNNSGSIPK